ncbi:MAG: hypothetical protein QXU88_02485 [Candidatus Woesearchaeota archaeon]
MAKDRRAELEEELEAYLAARKRRGFNFKELFAPAPSRITSKMPVETVAKEERLTQASKAAATAEAAESLAKEYESEKKGFFEKLLERLGLKRKEPEIISEPPNQDIKELARICFSVVKKLPPEELKGFKESEDFAKFKEILKRHNLIK